VETRVHNDFKKWFYSSKELIDIWSYLINLNLGWRTNTDFNEILLIVLVFPELLQLDKILDINPGDNGILKVNDKCLLLYVALDLFGDPLNVWKFQHLDL
jgi:hypothetical protein